MQSLADFLNHGTLPFIGRNAEIDRITGFWRGVYQATELRALLLTGEAGVGKSRLLEQVTGRITASGGSVVHVKLYPEASASFISLVARALWHPDAGRALLAEEPEAKLGAVGAALQRLARLRPTLLVLEDLHLLTAGALPELRRLLTLLADETISLLALARPVELEARAVLEPWLVDELLLQGLHRDDCAKVWEEIAGSATGMEVASALHDATAGNPLALRSALRAALKGSDATRPGNAWQGPGAAASLARTIKRSVGLLAEGMTVDLSREELDAARRLATLGEIFSREAADAMLGNAAPMLDALLFQGIIATAVAPPAPLPGEHSLHPPLGFTHTLLHRQLVDAPTLDADALVRVIADLPLYSVLPFRLLSDRWLMLPTLDTATIIRAFDRTIKAQITIGQSAQWRATDQTWATAVRLIGSRLGSWEPKDWERMLVKVVHHKLDLVRQQPREVRKEWLEYLTSLTDEASSDELITGRLFALFHRDLLINGANSEVRLTLWNEAEALVASRPELRFTFAYADYVIACCVGAYGYGDRAMMRLIDRRASELLAHDDLPTPVRAIFERKIRPPLLRLYDNEAELRARLDQVRELERTIDRSDTSVWNFCIGLLSDVGIVDMLVRACNDVIPIMKDQGLIYLAFKALARMQRVVAGARDSFASIHLDFERAWAEIPLQLQPQVDPTAHLLLVDAALLRGEPVRAREIIEHYHTSLAGELSPAQWITFALYAPDPRRALSEARESGWEEEEFASLIDSAINDTGAPDLGILAELFSEPILCLDDIMRTVAVTGLAALIIGGQSDREEPELITSVADRLNRSLEWLAAPERGLFAYMNPLLDAGRALLAPRQVTTWQKRIDALANSFRRKGGGGEGDGRLRLSMLGAIVARTPDGEQQRFQGARARMLLAMMVIGEMVREPLSSAEFCRLAAGGEVVEIESARDVVKTTVHRLREAIGHDAILTDGQTPRLNPARVEVDLLEAHRLLGHATEAMRRSSPMQAKAALMGALRITSGDVSFPSLYDDFIEAVREDFENELRITTIDVAKALAREGAIGDMVEVLEKATAALPGDEELAALLRDALLQAGRRAEAERARMKSEVV